MADKQKTKAPETTPPVPEPTPTPKPEPRPEPDNSADIMSAITEDMWKKGFYIRVQKHQVAARGLLLTWQVERITSSELETQELPDVLLEKFGNGVYRMHLHALDGKKIFEGRKFETAVGDVNDQRPARTQPGPANHPPEFRRPGFNPSPDPVRDNPDVRAKKAELEIKRLGLEEIELNQKIKAAQGGDQNQTVERVVSELGRTFKDSITLLTTAMTKPTDSDLKNQIAELNRKIDANAAAKETSGLFHLMTESNNKMFMWMLENSKNMSASQMEILKQMVDQKGGKTRDPLEQYKEFRLMMGMERDIRRENRDEFMDFQPDMPPAQVPWYKEVLHTITGIVQDFSKSGALNDVLTKMKNPPVQPAAGKVFTEAELNAVAQRMAEEEVRRQLAEWNKTKTPPVGTKTLPVETKAPDTIAPVIQSIPEGETAEEFQAKKEVVNNMMTVLLKEMILAPRDCEWIGIALGTFSEDLLDGINQAPEFPELFALLGKYADEKLILDLQARLATDQATPGKKKSNWLLLGFNTLKVEITEQKKSEALLAGSPATPPDAGHKK